MGTWMGRLGAVGVGVVAAVVLAGVAYAHVEVDADPAVAGSTNAVLTFDAAAESNSAGVASVRVVLPAGIAPADVTLTSGPSGWTLTPNNDGYTVGGPALPVGQNAVHSVTVARLPDETKLTFKTLVNYTDGSVDRWIEEATAANPRPGMPAPVLTLAPNPNPAPATSPPTEPPVTTPAATIPTVNPTPVTAPGDSGGGSTWLWWLLGAAVVIAIVTYLILRPRRMGAGL
jgi:uncharacterized protein YcnI